MSQQIFRPLRWVDVVATLRQYQVGAIIRLPYHQVEDPRAHQMKSTLNFYQSERRTFREYVGHNQDLVIVEQPEWIEAYLEVKPVLGPRSTENFLQTSPGTAVAGFVAAGALLGAAFGKNKNTALAGAAIGGLAGVLGVGLANSSDSQDFLEALTKSLTTLSNALKKEESPSSKALEPKKENNPERRKRVPRRKSQDTSDET